MNVFTDLFGITETELQEYVDAGWIRVQTHPELPLKILNYTEKTTFAKMWDHVTLNCRGLIYNTETGEVVARPFPKFFNYNEEKAPKFELHEAVVVNDKMDGSLGILYSHPRTKWNGGSIITFPDYEIATRGSFRSEQAIEAGEMYCEQYIEFNPKPGYTYLFEIIYPENRIVCNYGDRRELVLLGAVEIETGSVLSPGFVKLAHDWPGPVAQEFHNVQTYADALSMPPREGAEGIVVRGTRGRMVKIKQEDYVRLHRIITGLNERAVWEWMKESDYDASGMKENLPEEFWPWVDEIASGLLDLEASIWEEIQDEYFAKVVVGGDRGQNARAFAGSENSWALFAHLDEDYARVHAGIWKRIRPEGNRTPHTSSEEN